ncbi:MAG: hypothetical protein E3J73_04735 [Candidatus Bathyarchaeum sp.]|nr:MAG: hypothetical protein E3J73_04735 [Candidatus Bathyarchaeum sp.]
MKKIVAVMTLMFVLSFIVSSTNAIESRLIWTFYWEGLDIQIYAPYQAYPNDTMTIRIRVEAREELQDVTVRLRLYGSKSQGYLGWFNSFYALQNVDLSHGVVEDQYFEVDITDDVDPGLVYSQTSCSWKVQRGSSRQDQLNDGVFRVTYLRNKPYEDLQVTYNQLLADYNSLLSSYNNLQTNYDSLNSTYHTLLSDHSPLQASFNELKSKYEFGGEMANALNLMYVFIETTVIFSATTIYFLLRKQKLKKQT